MKPAVRDTPAIQPPPRDAGRADDEIDLLAYAAVCWRHRYLLLTIVVIVGAVTYAINRRMAPTYETRFRLMGSEPGLEEAAAGRLNVVAFRELVESQTEVAGLLAEFGLDRPPHDLTAQRFLDGHVDVEVIRDSTIIAVAVRLKNERDLLVKLARRYAERVVDTAQRLNTEGINYTAEKIRLERDAALQRLTVADDAYKTYQRRAQIELLRRDVDTLVDRRPDALDLNVQIQGVRARLAQAESELAKHEKVRTTRRGIDVLPASPAASGGAEDKPGDLKIRSDLLDPYVNPVYEALQRDISGYRAQLAGLEQERKELMNRLQIDAPSAEKLNRLYEAETALAALSRNRDVAQEAYLNAANKYEEARLQSTVRSPRLQILDAALPPDRPVAPRALRNTFAACLIALTLAAIAIVAFDYSRRNTASA